jgi:hypothetical protein
MEVANTRAYYVTAIITDVKRFIVPAPVWLGFFLGLKQECALPKPFFFFLWPLTVLMKQTK